MREVKERWRLGSRVWDRGDESTAGRRKFVYEGVCGGWINYPDAQGVMQPCDPAFSIGDSGGFNAMFTRIPRIVRFGDDGRKRIYPVPGNDGVWFQLYKPSELTLGAPTMKAGGVWTWDRTNYTFKLHLKPDRVKFSLLLKRDLGVNTLHLPFESQGLTRNGFDLLAGGQTVARLRKPFVRDALGVERDLEATIAGGEIVLTLDDTGLVYPLLIDPPLDLSVAASADDDRVNRLDTPAWNKTTTIPYVGSTAATAYKWGGSMRFTGVNIPSGATVNVAYLTLISSASRATTVVNSDLCAENASNPSQNTSYADHIGRTRTAAVPWDSIPAWTAGSSYQSPSIVTPVQTVVTDNGGTGDALKIFFEDKDGESSVEAYRQYASWDHATYNPPAIHLERTEAGGGGSTVQSSVSRRLISVGGI